MPRPKASASQQGRAYELYQEKLGPTAIFEKLREEFENPISARTVSAWIRGFRNLTKELTDLDAPFEYHRMGEYGLPWEAGGYLMEMWAWAREFWADLAEKLGDPEPPLPTVRLARWWWRVHLLVPEETRFDVYIWAQAFSWRELLQDVLDETADMTGLSAYLAYRPWESADQRFAYVQAVGQKRIPLPPNAWEEYLLSRRVRKVTGQPEEPALRQGVTSARVEARPSDIYAETVRGFIAKSADFNKRVGVFREREEQAKLGGPQ